MAKVIEIEATAVNEVDNSTTPAAVRKLHDGKAAEKTFAEVQKLHPRARKVTVNPETGVAHVFHGRDLRPEAVTGDGYDQVAALVIKPSKGKGKPDGGELDKTE